MNKNRVTLENVLETITEFYDEKKWHFMSVNGIDLGEEIEIQWIFTEYGKKESLVVYFALIQEDEIVPTITSIIPSAIMAEREIVDLLGVTIEGADKGLFLDEDSIKAPLRINQ